MSKTTSPTVGEIVDEIQLLQEERDAINATLKAKEAEIAAKMEALGALFDASGINGAKGAVGTAERKSQRVFNATDWPALHAFIAKTGAFDLLQKRLTSTAVAARFEEGEPIPGVESFDRYFITVRPAKETKVSLRRS